MAQYVKNDYNYHGARSKTRADGNSNFQPEHTNKQQKIQKSASKNSSRKDSWNSTSDDGRKTPNPDNGLWDNAPDKSWNQDSKVVTSSRNKRFNTNKGTKDFYVPCQSVPNWDEIESEFPSLEKATPPPVNCWDKRKEKMEQVKAIQPTNQTEEERMIQEAIEMSKKEANKDEERRKQLEEEYKLQMALLEANPELFEEFRTTDEVVGTYANNYLAQSKNDNHKPLSDDSAWETETQSQNKVSSNEYKKVASAKSLKSQDWGLPNGKQTPDWGLPNEAEKQVKSTKPEKRRGKNSQIETVTPSSRSSEILKTTHSTTAKLVKTSWDGKASKSSSEKQHNRDEDGWDSHDSQSVGGKDAGLRMEKDKALDKSDSWGNLDNDANQKSSKNLSWDENKDGWGNESAKTSRKQNVSKAIDMFGGWGNKPTGKSYDSSSVVRDKSTVVEKDISSKIESQRQQKSSISNKPGMDVSAKTNRRIVDRNDDTSENFQERDWCTADARQQNIATEIVEENKQAKNIESSTLDSDISSEIPELVVENSSITSPSVAFTEGSEPPSNSNYSFLLDNIVSDYADLAIKCENSSKNDTSLLTDAKGQNNSIASHFSDNYLLQGEGENPALNCDYSLLSKRAVSEESNYGNNNSATQENPGTINSSNNHLQVKSNENISANEKTSDYQNSFQNPSSKHFTFNEMFYDRGTNSLALSNQDACSIDPPQPINVGPGSTVAPLSSEPINPAFLPTGPEAMTNTGPMNPDLPPESFNRGFPMPMNPMMAGMMNPNLMMAMNPLMMQQMLMMSNPFFLQQLQHMDMYYKSLGMSLGTGLPLYPQPVPFPNGPAMHNPASNMFSTGGPVMDAPIPPPSAATGLTDIPLDADDSTDWLKEFLTDDTYIPPPRTLSPAEDHHQTFNPDQDMNANAVKESTDDDHAKQTKIAPNENVVGWGDLKTSSSQQPKLPGFNEKVDGWGNENMTVRSMRNSRHASGKSVRQPTSQPHISNQ